MVNQTTDVSTSMIVIHQTQKLRCLQQGSTPLTISNREVKPLSADGTAVTGGRVGRCQPL